MKMINTMAFMLLLMFTIASALQIKLSNPTPYYDEAVPDMAEINLTLNFTSHSEANNLTQVVNGSGTSINLSQLVYLYTFDNQTGFGDNKTASFNRWGNTSQYFRYNGSLRVSYINTTTGWHLDGTVNTSNQTFAYTQNTSEWYVNGTFGFYIRTRIAPNTPYTGIEGVFNSPAGLNKGGYAILFSANGAGNLGGFRCYADPLFQGGLNFKIAHTGLAGKVKNNTWHNIYCGYNGTHWYVALDGVIKGSVAMTQDFNWTISPTVYKPTIMATTYFRRFWGDADSFMLFEESHNASQILLMNKTRVFANENGTVSFKINQTVDGKNFSYKAEVCGDNSCIATQTRNFNGVSNLCKWEGDHHWYVNFTKQCEITTEQNLAKYNLTVVGNGSLRLHANLTTDYQPYIRGVNTTHIGRVICIGGCLGE